MLDQIIRNIFMCFGCFPEVTLHIYRQPTKLQKGNVFMCLSVHRREIPCDHCPWYIGPHCVGPTPTEHEIWSNLFIGLPIPEPPTWDLSPPNLPPPLQTRDLRTHNPLLVKSGGHHWRPVHRTPLWRWHLVAIEVTGLLGTKRWYTSYRNAFLIAVFEKSDTGCLPLTILFLL